MKNVDLAIFECILVFARNQSFYRKNLPFVTSIAYIILFQEFQGLIYCWKYYGSA